MSTGLQAYVEKQVLVITVDGRTIAGLLKGFDQTTNVILSNATERVYSSEDPVEEVPLGLYIVRGDNVAMIGQVAPELEKEIDLSSQRADPIPAFKI